MDMTAALRAFVRTIERGSITAAARDLGVSQPAVSKLLRNLETHAGARLLERSTRAVCPTPQGMTLYEASGMSLAMIDAALEAVRSDMGTVGGSLRVHSPVCIGESHLHKLLATFQDRYPSVTIDLTLENRAIDLIHENFDVAVRIGRPSDQASIVRKVGLVRRILVASPDYLARHKKIRSPQSLGDHKLIVTDTGLSRQGGLTLCRGATTEPEIMVKPILRTNNVLVLTAALKSGRGIGPIQVPLVVDELKSGTLVRILPQYEVKSSELYITYPTSRFLRPVVRTFVDFVAPALKSIEGIY